MRDTRLMAAVILASAALLASCATVEPEPDEVAVAVEPDAPPAPTFDIVGVDGNRYSLTDLTQTSSAFLVFWKEVCPHNPRAMPLYNAMTEAYGDDTPLLHVVWVAPEGAVGWTEQLDAKGPVLPDPAGELVNAYNMVESVVTVEVGTDGRIAQVYGGYGQEEMGRLNEALARAVGAPVAALDFSAAPEKQTYG